MPSRIAVFWTTFGAFCFLCNYSMLVALVRSLTPYQLCSVNDSDEDFCSTYTINVFEQEKTSQRHVKSIEKTAKSLRLTSFQALGTGGLGEGRALHRLCGHRSGGLDPRDLEPLVNETSRLILKRSTVVVEAKCMKVHDTS